MLRSLMNMPSALTLLNPPSRWRTAWAIALAIVQIFGAQIDIVGDEIGAGADDNGAEAGDAGVAGPEVGRATADLASWRQPSNSPWRTSARLRRCGARLPARRGRQGYPALGQCARPSVRASCDAFSIVAARTGTKGITSTAPMRGCVPCVLAQVDGSRAWATRAKTDSASASGSPIRVMTERLWSASEVMSMTSTPGRRAARAMASMTSWRCPSLKFSGHSTSGSGTMALPVRAVRLGSR